MKSACTILSLACPLHNIFPHYLINGTIFGKRLLNTKCVFWFSVQLLSETFLILRRTERVMIINVHRSSRTVPATLIRFSERWNFHDRFSKKSSGVKFHENPSRESWVPCRRTDGRTDGRTDEHDEASSNFSQFCERTWKVFFAVVLKRSQECNFIYVAKRVGTFCLMRL